MLKLDQDILRAYDIRGVVGANLDSAIAFVVGRAFATIASRRLGRPPRLCSAYDGRISSPELEMALVDGMITSGAEVLRLGVGPTPMLYFAVKTGNRDGGVMVTGSHNPPEYNGFKFTLDDLPFWDDDIQLLGTVAESGDFVKSTGHFEQKVVEHSYVKRLLEEYNSKVEYSVVWDAGNGAAGGVIRSLTEQLPGEHFLLNATIDGTFPSHHPDPTVISNLQQLIQSVRDEGADLGIAFDGDGDRIGVVDDKGRVIWGDQLLTLYAQDLLKDMPGASIIADVKSSNVFFDEVRKCGGTPIMWRTGHSPIKKKMAELSSPLAGEMSGHIFFGDRYYGFDDALYAAVRLLRLLSRSKLSLAALCNKLPQTLSTPEIRFPCKDSEKFLIVERVRLALCDTTGVEINDLDGVRVTTPDGWWLLRASNTQPVLVARCEAWDSEGMRRLRAMLGEKLREQGVASPFADRL